ncbi:MAG: efflux RND transporter periplasmic adaptor subunit [Anaeromyxobacteraceae bacterium]
MSDTRQAHDAMPEGEERPPPGVHTAGVVRWAIVALVALAAAGAWTYHAVSGGALTEARTYQCPMHPTVVQARPGECPICGMDLVKAGAATPAASNPVAPGHGAAKRPGDEGRPAAAEKQFTCPMHLAFVTADPKARCPDCGMKLVPVGPAAGEQAAAPAPEPIPGLAAVELSADRIQLMGLRTIAAARQPLAAHVHTVGFVTADEGRIASVTTRFAGWVESLPARATGQPVGAGQVLAALYSPDMVNAQQVFLNAIRWTESNAKQELPNALTGATSGPERDARQRLELAGFAPQDFQELQKTGKPQRAVNIRSPVRGHVARRSVVQGAYVQPGTELFQIADLSQVWVLVDVYEADLGRVRAGQRATLQLAAYPGRTFEGKVDFLYPAVSTGTRALQARVVLPNRELELKPGMYGDVTIETEATEALALPREAVVDTGDVQYVFVSLGKGRFEPRRVRVGPQAGGRVAILSGLAEGDHVVTAASFLLDSESRLQATLLGAPAAAGGH